MNTESSLRIHCNISPWLSKRKHNLRVRTIWTVMCNCFSLDNTCRSHRMEPDVWLKSNTKHLILIQIPGEKRNMLKVQIFQTEKLLPPRKIPYFKTVRSSCLSSFRNLNHGEPIIIHTQIDKSGQGRMGWGSVHKGLGGLLHFCHANAKVNRGCFGNAHALRSRAAFFFTAPRMYCKRWVFPENNRARLKQSKTDTLTDRKKERDATSTLYPEHLSLSTPKPRHSTQHTEHKTSLLIQAICTKVQFYFVPLDVRQLVD